MSGRMQVGREYVGHLDEWREGEAILTDEEVVRCRECIRLREIGPVLRCEHVGRFVRPEDFCVWGKRRDA